MNTNPRLKELGQQEHFDLLTLLSFLRTSIASARLSGRPPSVFDLECLETLHSVSVDVYEARYCTPSAKPVEDHLAELNAETSGAK